MAPRRYPLPRISPLLLRREAASSDQPDPGGMALLRLIILPLSQRNATSLPSASEVPTTSPWLLMSSAVLGASSSPSVPRSSTEPFLQITPCAIPLTRSQDPAITPRSLIAWPLQKEPPGRSGSWSILPACQRKALGLPLRTRLASPTTSPWSLMSRALL